MRKKIILIAICIAACLIMPLSNAANQGFQDYKMEYGGNPSFDAPEWNVGNYWEYDMLLDVNVLTDFGFLNITYLGLSLKNVEFLVDDVNNDEYILELSGFVEHLIWKDYEYSPDASYMTGTASIDKSSLGFKEIILNLVGDGKSIGYDINMNINFDPYFNLLCFPMSLYDEWDVYSSIDVSISGSIYFFGANIPANKEIDTSTISGSLSVDEFKEHSCTAGAFNSYKITGDSIETCEIWYAPDAGFYTDFNIYQEFKLGNIVLGYLDFDMDLLSTNFNHPENNSAPNQPSIDGLTSGEPNEECTFTVTASDPEGEDICYNIDWGDGTFSGWTIGPFESGEEVSVSHAYPKEAEYRIRVKAKDAGDHQSIWSEPFDITISDNENSYQQSQSQQSSQQSSSSSIYSSTLDSTLLSSSIGSLSLSGFE